MADTYATVKAQRKDLSGSGSATIQYELNGQVSKFDTDRVTGSPSQLLIFGGAEIGIYLQYPSRLEEGEHILDMSTFKEVSVSIGIDQEFNLKPNGRIVLKVTQLPDRYVFAGTILEATVSDGEKIFKFSWKFEHSFP